LASKSLILIGSVINLLVGNRIIIGSW